MSKRTLKKVIRRHFRDLFCQLLVEEHGEEIYGEKVDTEVVREAYEQIIGSIPKEETLGGGRSTNLVTTTTYYPDSLDMRSVYNKLSKRG